MSSPIDPASEGADLAPAAELPADPSVEAPEHPAAELPDEPAGEARPVGFQPGSNPAMAAGQLDFGPHPGGEEAELESGLEEVGTDGDELSLAEASELVGVSTRALRDRVQRGSLPARKVTREGRILSVVRRSDLLDIYGWMVAEGERKRQVDESGRRPVEPAAPRTHDAGVDSLGDAARELRHEVDRLQSALVDVTAEMRLVREAHARQREQDIRARAEHEREIQTLQERAAALANEMRAQRSADQKTMLGRTPWEVIAVSLLLTAVVFGLWVRFQRAEAEDRELSRRLVEALETLEVLPGQGQ